MRAELAVSDQRPIVQPMIVPTAPASPADLLWRCAYRVGYRLMLAWWWLRRPAAHGAAVAIRCGDDVLLVRQSFRPNLDLPAGGIGAGERARDAAIRELKEELGIAVPAEELCYLGLFLRHAEHRTIMQTVFLWHSPERLLLHLDGREVIEAVWWAVAALDDTTLGPGARLYGTLL